MKYIKEFESFETETSFSPMTRRLAGEGIDAVEQTDRLDTDHGCDRCADGKRKKQSYCTKCSKCLLDKEQTQARMASAASDRDRFRLKKCMDKHGLSF